MSREFVKLEGISELSMGLKDRAHMNDVKAIVKQNGAELQSKAQDNMDQAYTKGYSTGATKRSTTVRIADRGLTAIVGPHTKYFSYLEYGTRFMDAKPTLGPALTYQSIRFVDQLNRLFM